jgi:hypothetical protein
MSFFKHLSFGGTPLSSHTLVIISDSGTRAVYNISAEGQNHRVLEELEANKGSLTVMQLAQRLHQPDIEKLKVGLRELKAHGLVRFAGEESAVPMEE